MNSKIARKAAPGRLIFFAMLSGMAVRLIIIAILYKDFLVPWRDHWEFAYEVGMIAKSIVEGHGFGNPFWGISGPTALVSPVFPYMVAGIFKLFGVKTVAAAWALLSMNCLFSVLTCIPVFFIANRTMGTRVAKISVWVWAFYPYAIYFSADSMWYHSLLALLMTCLFLTTLQMKDSTRVRTWIDFGVLSGVTALTSPVAIAAVPFLAGWAAYRLRQSGFALTKQILVAMLAFFAVLAPWLVRNYETFHKPVFLRDSFWMEIGIGNVGNSVHWDNAAVYPAGSEFEKAEFRRLGELNYLEYKKNQAIGYIEKQPLNYLVRSLRRFVYTWTGFWSLNAQYLKEESMDPFNIILWLPFSMLSLFGLYKAFRVVEREAVLFALLVTVYPLVYYFTHPGLQYRLAIDPELVILASFAIVCWRGPSKRKSAASVTAEFVNSSPEPTAA